MITEMRFTVLIALVLAFSLAVANHFAEPQVRAEQQAYERRQLEAIVGSGFDIADAELINGRLTHVLLKAGDPVGQLEKLSTMEGYNGEIQYWLGTQMIAGQHKILGVRVIRHDETPGLGDKLELAISDWILGFNGLGLTDATWDVKKHGGDFDQFTGATITPRALVKSIGARLELLDQEGAPNS